jgi:hypothetical protein
MESVGQEPPPYIANLAKRHRKRKHSTSHTAIGSTISHTREKTGISDQPERNTRNFMSTFVSAGDVHDSKVQTPSTITIVPPKAGPKPQVQPAAVDIKVQSAIDRAKAIAETSTRQYEGTPKKKSRWDAS